MKNSLFSTRFLENPQQSYAERWQLALENYQIALQEFKEINPKPKSQYKILKFKKTSK